MYSVIINADSSYVPDILSLFYDFVMDQLIYLPAAENKPRMLRVPEFTKYTKLVDKKPVVSRYIIICFPLRTRFISSREDMHSLKKVVLDLCEEEIPEQQLFIDNEKDSMEDKVRSILPILLELILIIFCFSFFLFVLL